MPSKPTTSASPGEVVTRILSPNRRERLCYHLAGLLATTLLSLAVAVPAGYAYGRLRFRGRRPLAFYALFTQIAPPIGLLIPYFYFLNQAGLMDTHAGLVAVYLTFSVPFGTGS